MSTRSSSARSSSPWCCSCRAACSGSCRAGTGSRERSDAAPTHVASLRSRSSPMLTYNSVRSARLLPRASRCSWFGAAWWRRARRGGDDLMATTVLEIERLKKRFGGVTAVDGVSLRLDAGRIYGLIGPNGSGKTTLFNCITGVDRADEGQIRFKEQRIEGLKPHQIFHRGIGRTFQVIRVFPELTALENLLVVTTNDYPAALARAKELLAFVKLEGLAGEFAGNLSYGQQKLVEFVRVLMTDPELILLDESAAGVNRTLLNELLDAVRILRDRGKTVLLVEHDMKVVMGLCETVFVLDHGEKLAEGPPGVIQTDERVIEAYFGR